jgi:hypothetical protein
MTAKRDEARPQDAGQKPAQDAEEPAGEGTTAASESAGERDMNKPGWSNSKPAEPKKSEP